MCACVCVFVCVCRGEWKGLGCGANGVLLIVALGTGQKHGCVSELRRLVHISLRFKCAFRVRSVTALMDHGNMCPMQPTRLPANAR